jgi:hypothetical protein
MLHQRQCCHEQEKCTSVMHAVDRSDLPVERLKGICVDSLFDSFTGGNRRMQTDTDEHAFLTV